MEVGGVLKSDGVILRSCEASPYTETDSADEDEEEDWEKKSSFCAHLRRLLMSLCPPGGNLDFELGDDLDICFWERHGSSFRFVLLNEASASFSGD